MRLYVRMFSNGQPKLPQTPPNLNIQVEGQLPFIEARQQMAALTAAKSSLLASLSTVDPSYTLTEWWTSCGSLADLPALVFALDGPSLSRALTSLAPLVRYAAASLSGGENVAPISGGDRPLSLLRCAAALCCACLERAEGGGGGGISSASSSGGSVITQEQFARCVAVAVWTWVCVWVVPVCVYARHVFVAHGDSARFLSDSVSVRRYWRANLAGCDTRTRLFRVLKQNNQERNYLIRDDFKLLLTGDGLCSCYSCTLSSFFLSLVCS